MRRPSDLGFDDREFALPPLVENHHLVEAEYIPDGALFSVPATNLFQQREEKKRTLQERCARAAGLANAESGPSVLWCHMNDEANLLEKLVPGAIQISGNDSDDAKEEKFLAFIDGKVSKLVTKPKIGALGLNFQHCAHMTYFPSHSYEQKYQAVRRFYRFGQKRTVVVDVVFTEGERRIFENLNQKSVKASVMFENLVTEMRNELSIEKQQRPQINIEVPTWIQ